EVAGPGWERGAEVAEDAIGKSFLPPRSGKFDTAGGGIGDVADGSLHGTAGPLEHAAGEVPDNSSDGRIEGTAGELHGALAEAGEGAAVVHGLSARQIDDGPGSDVEPNAAGVGTARQIDGVTRCDVEDGAARVGSGRGD